MMRAPLMCSGNLDSILDRTNDFRQRRLLLKEQR